jgi:hypothetical protein
MGLFFGKKETKAQKKARELIEVNPGLKHLQPWHREVLSKRNRSFQIDLERLIDERTLPYQNTCS